MFVSPILVVLAILILGFGILLYKMGIHVLENDHAFFMVIAVFFVVYIITVLVFRHYAKLPPGSADVSSLTTIFSR